jgi:hypothetical protein
MTWSIARTLPALEVASTDVVEFRNP